MYLIRVIYTHLNDKFSHQKLISLMDNTKASSNFDDKFL